MADPYSALQSEAGGLVAGPANLLVNAVDRVGIAANGKPNLSIADAATRMTGGEPGWSRALGVGFTVTYAYRASAPADMPEDTAGFTRFNAAQIAQTELALDAWSDVANITFLRIGLGTSGEGAYSNNAAILLGGYTSGESGASAFSYFPGSTISSSPAGDVWVNVSLSYNASPTAGNFGGQVLVHELGHAIGLDHPSDYDSTEGGTFSYAADASYFEDSRQYTVMSYFSEANTGADFRGTYASAPLLDDIAAAQQEYGANMSTRTGDTVYGFNSTATQPWFAATSASSRLVFAIWDAGGNDTLDLSGYANNQTIDLRPGNFSNVGGLTGNVAIAANVRIENARGGSGADRIIGNAYGDNISGGAGADTITAGDGANYLRGDDGDDQVTGGAAFDDINGNKGQDTIHGGAGDDWVVGGQGNDLLFGDAGADVVLGNLGNDTLEGGAGGDVVRGGQGDDIILGGDGDNWLSGDRGVDTMTGGLGADIFHSFSGAGLDWATDFRQADGDRVQLDPGSVYSAYQAGADTVVDMGGGDQLILKNVPLSGLAAGWIFVA